MWIQFSRAIFFQKCWDLNFESLTPRSILTDRYFKSNLWQKDRVGPPPGGGTDDSLLQPARAGKWNGNKKEVQRTEVLGVNSYCK